MITIGIFEAKGSLGQLAQSAAEGEVIVLTRRGKPVAEIRCPEGDNAQANTQQAINDLRKFRHMQRLPVHFRESGASVFELHALAIQHQLTSDDALYLEAALATGLPLATRDKTLQQAAIESGVGVWAG